MKNVNDILKGANLYSIEYTGYFTLKLSLSNKSLLYNSTNELLIEFNSGFILHKGSDLIESKEKLFDLFGLNILNLQINNDNLSIYFEEDYKMETMSSGDNLIDRNWVIRSIDNKTFIINDSNDIFYSDNLNN